MSRKSKNSGLSDGLKQCAKIVDYFTAHKESVPFREPVDWRALGLTDYPIVVKQAMDLSTVKRKLNEGAYRRPEDFAVDMRLIWSNCMDYNQEGSEFYALAENYRSTFVDKFAKVRVDEVPDEERMPTKVEMEAFSEEVQRLNAYQRGKLVSILDERCKKCIEKPRENEIEINVDHIDARTFSYAYKFLKDSISDGSSEPKRRSGEGGGDAKTKKSRNK